MDGVDVLRPSAGEPLVALAASVDGEGQGEIAADELSARE